jgi:hypothetical protein
MGSQYGQTSFSGEDPGDSALRLRLREDHLVVPVVPGPRPRGGHPGPAPGQPGQVSGRPARPADPAADDTQTLPPVVAPAGPTAGGPMPPANGSAAPPARARQPEPPWGTVLATTLRLWSQRRRAAAGRRLGARQSGGRVLAVTILVAGLLAAGATAVAEGAPPAGQPAARQQAASQSPARKQPASRRARAALAAAAAVRAQAAAWVAGQVSGEAIVSCDPAMCAELQRHGLAAGRLLALGPHQSDPLGSDLVVATAAVRSEFGARLAGVYAPVRLARIGSGAARIDVLAVAPDGSAAYRAALAADLRARRTAGSQLARNPRVHMPASAGARVSAGAIDSRLLVALATLAALHPLSIVSFGPPPPGASPGVPVRSAVITGARGPHPGSPASLPALRAFLAAQRSPYLPASLRVVRAGQRGNGLAVRYPVPGPLGLLGPRS